MNIDRSWDLFERGRVAPGSPEDDCFVKAFEFARPRRLSEMARIGLACGRVHDVRGGQARAGRTPHAKRAAWSHASAQEVLAAGVRQRRTLLLGLRHTAHPDLSSILLHHL